MRPVHAVLALAVAGWHRLPRAVRLLGPFAVMAILWWTSSQSPSDGEPSALRSWLHNGAHVIAYGGLAGAWLTVFLLRADAALRLAARHAVMALLLTVAYGVVDEWHQSHVPGRDCSAVDVGSDFLGGCIAVVLVSWSVRRHPRLPRSLPWLLLLAAANVSLATFGPW